MNIKSFVNVLVIGGIWICGMGTGSAAPEYPQSDSTRYTRDYSESRSDFLKINGRLFAENGCISRVEISFSQPMNIVSLLGKVLARADYVSDKVFDTFFSGDFRSAILRPTGGTFCKSQFGPKLLIFKKGIQTEEGAGSKDELEVPLDYQGPGGVASFSVTTLLDTVRPRPQIRPTSGSTCPPEQLTACIINTRVTSRVGLQSVNNAVYETESWFRAERHRPEYNNDSLKLLPLNDTILVPRYDGNRAHHFGRPDIISVIRRAGKFVQKLFPDLTAVGVADISTASGVTPHVTWPDGSVTYLHPEHSHVGDDADMGYIAGPGGNDKNAPIDIEQSFWLLYAVLESSGVDLIYTAYKPEFVSYAKEAYELGLINMIALARVQSARVIQDRNMNHDTHMHVKVTNTDNRGRTYRFLSEDRVFNCMIGLVPGRSGSGNNFCVRL